MTAEIWAIETAERRGQARRILQLRVGGQTSQGAVDAVIRNLSENGLLLETAADLALGERLHVGLPAAGMRAATVTWSRPPFFGCEFSVPLTKGIVSAALLLAPTNAWSDNVDNGSWLGSEPNFVESGALQFDGGALRVLGISLALLFWVVVLFINIVMPVRIS